MRPVESGDLVRISPEYRILEPAIVLSRRWEDTGPARWWLILTSSGIRTVNEAHMWVIQ